uniref:SCP domain-containing protein n=1 Tax=Mesocestoides corti TaxID=53468 RepID=A0A5K3G132_MESCO
MLKLLCLLGLMGAVLSEVPSQEERIAILKCHRRLRKTVQPPASNMQLITYSEEMEDRANKFLAKCPGSTLDSSPVFKDIAYIITSKFNEDIQFRDVLCKVDGRHYIYENDTCSGYCFGYKQMVWAESTTFGCAKQKCPLDDGSTLYFSMLTCFYTPGDVYQTGRPYEQGRSCSKCPQGSGCFQNQCTTEMSPIS